MLAPAAAVAFVMLPPAAAVAFVMLAACAFASWAAYTTTVTKLNIIAADMINDICLFIHKLMLIYRDKCYSPAESPQDMESVNIVILQFVMKPQDIV